MRGAGPRRCERGIARRRLAAVAPRHVLRRLLRRAARHPLDRERGGSVAYPASADPRSGVSAHRPIRRARGHVVDRSLHNAVVRHLLPSVRCDGRQH